MPRCRFLLPLAAMLLAVVVRADETTKGEVFTSKEGKFTITFPKKPTKQTQKVKTSLGELEVHLYIVDQKDRGFITGTTDYPKGSIKDENREKMMDGARDGNVKSMKGKLLSEKKVTLGKKKHQGRELLIEMPAIKGVYRSRLFLVGDRLYQIVALWPEEFVKSKETTAYMDSFKLDE